MGGAVSSGRDNNELIDNLMGGNYIRSRHVEKVFRALDRAEYMTPEARDQAYKDLAWRNGPLHMSAPCIYSEVMENLELKPGLSFLNVGSGTGYLSTLVGLILGSSGINHGIEVHPQVVEYSIKMLQLLMETSPIMDEFDFCEPKFYCGNGLCLAPLSAPYDRVYCGAGCPEEYQTYFQQLIKVGGVLVMPLNDNLLQVKRTSESEWSTRSVLNVSFASLRVPGKQEEPDLVRLDEQTPARLQALARSVIRESMRGAMRRRHPQLREPPPRAPPAKKACPRRICIPVDGDSDARARAEGIDALHDLDPENGAHEMNALLSLVLSMGRNRVAGALRVDPIDSHSSDTEHGDDGDADDDGNDDDAPGNGGDAAPRAAEGNGDPQSNPEGSRTEHPENGERPSAAEAVLRLFDQERGDDRPERSNRRERHSRSVRAERSQQRDRSARSDRGDRRNRDSRSDRRHRRNRSERRDRSSRSDGTDQSERRRSIFMLFCGSSNGSNGPNPEDDSRVTTGPEAQSIENIYIEESTGRGRLASVLASTSDNTNEDPKESTSEDAMPLRRTPKMKANLKSRNRKSRKPRDCRRSRSSQNCNGKKDGKKSNPEVPVDVEILLGSSKEQPGTSTMEWQPVQPVKTEQKTEVAEGAEPKEHSSGDETETSTSKTKEEKRQKLDSGIGDDNTVSASPHSSKQSDSSDSRTHTHTDTDSDSSTDEGVDATGRRRRQKRGHLSTRSSSPTDDDADLDESNPEGDKVPSRRHKRSGHSGDQPRRVTLSLYMKRGIKELPLPYPLQKYVNLGRCFEFE